MSTFRTRIARFGVASVLTLGLGAAAAGPALAAYNSWAGSVPPASSVAADDDASPDRFYAAGEDASPNSGGTWSG